VTATRAGRLHVLDHPAGNGAAPTAEDRSILVVLVHGSLDRASSFSRVVRRLHDLHVLTYDRRGYHRSRSVLPPATSLEDHVTDLAAIVEGHPSVVIGHSYGGDVALGAALAAPSAVRAVGVYEPPVPWSDFWPRRSVSDIVSEDPAVYAESFFRRLVGPEAWERLPERTKAERRADGPALVAELADLRRGQPPFDLAAVTVPVFLGRGSDSLPHHRRAIDFLETVLPVTETVEFEGARHGAHLSHPDAFADFVRRVAERGSGRT
jgi:pimeloyl-ACP methyl ester carboxylesterase